MKTQLTVLVRIALLAVLAALPFQVPAQAQPPDQVDGFTDLAGLLTYDSSAKGRLHTTPSEETEVLQALGAVAVSSTRFRADVEGVPVTFDILRTDLPGLFMLSDEQICANSQVRVFRNRKCKETIPYQYGYCLPLGNGQFATYLQIPTRLCQPEPNAGYCVEYKRAWFTRDLWADDQCTIKVKQDVLSRFIC